MDNTSGAVEVIYTDPFLSDLAQIEQDSKLEEIFAFAELLCVTPELGSKKLPAAIIDRFGGTVYRFVIPPFLIIYEYEEEKGRVILLGLMHTRQTY